MELSDNKLIIKDEFELGKRIVPDVERFLVQGEVYIEGDEFNGRKIKAGELVVVNSGVAVRMSYPSCLKPSVDVRTLDDPRLTNVWGGSLRRISLTTPEDAPLNGRHVFEISRL